MKEFTCKHVKKKMLASTLSTNYFWFIEIQIDLTK